MNTCFHSKSSNIKIIFYSMGLILCCLLFTEISNAITVEALQAPIEALKKEIFGGWMVAVKICAATVGIIMSVFRGSLTPFGIGAGLAAGIHLYDAYIKVDASAALI